MDNKKINSKMIEEIEERETNSKKIKKLILSPYFIIGYICSFLLGHLIWNTFPSPSVWSISSIILYISGIAFLLISIMALCAGVCSLIMYFNSYDYYFKNRGIITLIAGVVFAITGGIIGYIIINHF